MATPEVVGSAYAQVLSLGLLWTTVHCAGMCGPLLCGFDLGGVRIGASVLTSSLRVLLYQMGRGLTYTWLGALSGLVGASLSQFVERAGAILALSVGLVILVSSLVRLLPRSPVRIGKGPPARSASFWESLLSHGVRAVSSIDGPLGPLALGVAMGFLPCMISLWVLGLAALSGSAIQGACLMLLLVALTTPVLLLTMLVSRTSLRLSFGRVGQMVPTLLLAVSGLWMILVGAAAFGLIDHVHLVFSLPISGRAFLLMLW